MILTFKSDSTGEVVKVDVELPGMTLIGIDGSTRAGRLGIVDRLQWSDGSAVEIITNQHRRPIHDDPQA